MHKLYYPIAIVLSMIIVGINYELVFASTKDKPRNYEEIYPGIGYKSVDKAVKEFEKHFKQELKLPIRLPPLAFTHSFGRFNDLEGDINDSFEIEYVNDQISVNHYMIDVRPIQHKIPFREEHIAKKLKLSNGIEADYIVYKVIRALVFERDGWQYRLSIDRRLTEKVTPEMLVKIADSIDYPTKKDNLLE
ncbi:hypothetical protein ACFSCX_19010 [Bacillus salitolerans]|uniref:DUF4367 domain-containing protein n=1 Tax=Bacillus salitolerans TaxID=1437434 RepID=A0ABW4LU93_9BACI